MKELQIINEQKVLGKEFKIYGSFEEPLFLAKDVAKWIEHSDVSTMLRSVDSEEKVTNTVCTPGGNQNAWFLTENGLYEVLMQSRKPIAKEFKKQVKAILKSLRKGESKIIPMNEYQKAIIETREANARIRKATILERIAKEYEGTYKQILHAYATKELSGDFILPLPKAEKQTYSATEIGEILGVSANKIGRIAKEHNLKTEQYGALYHDKAKNSNKEVETFRYFENVIPVLKKYM